MAAYTGGYQAPQSYGYQPGMNGGYQPTYAPYQQRVDMMQQQYQPYQSQQPNMPQQIQPIQNQTVQNAPQPQNSGLMAFSVFSEEEARNHGGFTVDGRRHLYYNENEPDKVYMRYFDMMNGGQNVFKVGTLSDPENPTSPTETPQGQAENDDSVYLTKDQLKPLEDKFEGLQSSHEKILAMLEGLEEKFNEFRNDDKRNDKEQSGGTAEGSTDKAELADGSKSGRPGKKPDAGSAAGSK